MLYYLQMINRGEVVSLPVLPSDESFQYGLLITDSTPIQDNINFNTVIDVSGQIPLSNSQIIAKPSDLCSFTDYIRFLICSSFLNNNA